MPKKQSTKTHNLGEYGWTKSWNGLIPKDLMDDFGYLRFCSYIFVAGGAKEYNHQNGGTE